MQNAPSVVYPVGRSSWMGWIAMALGLAIMAAALLAGISMQPSGGVWLAMLLPWLIWCGWAWRQWRQAPGGWLGWHGHQQGAAVDSPRGQWRWQTSHTDDGIEVRSVEPVLDLQSRWLLRLEGLPGVPRWVCVEAGADPANWSALRRALTAVRTAP